MKRKRQELVKIYTGHKPLLSWYLNFLILELAGIVSCGPRGSCFVVNFPRLILSRRYLKYVALDETRHENVPPE